MTMSLSVYAYKLIEIIQEGTVCLFQYFVRKLLFFHNNSLGSINKEYLLMR